MNAPLYDLILQGGHVICPASGVDGVMDVAISGGKIAFVGKDILPSMAAQITDVRGKLVLPGMIDTHAHIYRYVTGRFGLEADMVGVESGVTSNVYFIVSSAIWLAGGIAVAIAIARMSDARFPR